MQIFVIFYCIYAAFFEVFLFSQVSFSTSISKQTYKWQLHSLIVSASYSNSFPQKAAKSTQEQTEDPNKKLEVLTQTLSFPVSWEIPPPHDPQYPRYLQEMCWYAPAGSVLLMACEGSMQD